MFALTLSKASWKNCSKKPNFLETLQALRFPELVPNKRNHIFDGFNTVEDDPFSSIEFSEFLGELRAVEFHVRKKRAQRLFGNREVEAGRLA